VYRWRILVAVATVVGCAVALGTAERTTGAPAQEMVLTMSGEGSRGSGHYSFAISGTTPKDLFPGATREIELTFANPSTAALRINRVRGRLTATSRTGCRPVASNLTIKDYHGRLPVLVRPLSRKTAGSLTILMPRSVANACQGATFDILLTGDATEAAR
jgi:hypothetical protein